MDPNPLKKHPAVLLAKVRDAIEPSLAAAGFQFDGRNKPPVPDYIYLDYSRGNDLFRLAWDTREDRHFIGFVAELMHESATVESIYSKNLSCLAKLPHRETNAELQLQMDAFIFLVTQFLDGLASSKSPSDLSSQ